MKMQEFIENHCGGKEFDSCVPCTYYSASSGCCHQKHPENEEINKIMAYEAKQDEARTKKGEKNMKKITRARMIEDLDRKIEEREIAEKEQHGFAKSGSARRRRIATNLRKRLLVGENPTIREIVGHYGKGARFAKEGGKDA
jgi:hypothetical protein